MKEEKPVLSIKYWGTRGSVPSPLSSEEIKEKEFSLVQRLLSDIRSNGFNIDNLESPDDVRKYLNTLPESIFGSYGGETTCVQVSAKDSPLIILDAGTGIRKLGNDLVQKLFQGKNLNSLNSNEETKKEIHLAFSHYHWDHLQGLPFFKPAFIGIPDKQVKINFYGKKDATKTISEVLRGQQQFPNFPVVWEDMPCDRSYHPLDRMLSVPIEIGEATMTYKELSHPDSVFAYRIQIGDRGFVFATDTEHRDSPDPRITSLSQDADIMYYDGQYTPEEYIGKVGIPRVDWGHSTYEWGVLNALAANVSTLVIGHHDPERSDKDIENILDRANTFRDIQTKSGLYSGQSLEIVMGRDGLKQNLY